MKKKSLSMEVVNPDAAGIDVGSRSHYVAIGQKPGDVREFGVYNEDLLELLKWLQENNITTVAMESTGTYWQSLFATLQAAGLEVYLCNGKFTKNIKGRKTDVQDCQWIQKLHSLGLLTSSFLPDLATEQLRTYCRHRTSLLETSAMTTLKMQKYLRLLNLRLDVVVSDVCGLTGLAIIEAICKGETNPTVLASLRHGNCRKSAEEIAKALQSNGRKDYLFGLQQEFDLYKILQAKIEACDVAIAKLLTEQINQDQTKKALQAEAKPHKKVNKNAPKHMDLNQVAYQYFDGVDLMGIEGVSHGTVIALMSEVGSEGIKKFATAKQFASWLRLTPNTRISGGKVISKRIAKGSNRLKIALRQAANAVGNLKDTHLSDFFNRISYRRGRTAAVSATARKLAVIIWNMIVKHVPYNPPSQYLFMDQKRKMKLVKKIRNKIAKLDLKPQDVGFSMN
ncbi:IS110 family transposase [Rhodocytophaga rosea]|uniref:IS110 family transposase n=1 Tax=Rhodocytophaga rosea TaxID=2704465 RepID=A0A6C0GEK9_9BACT|nr:IS110 family transposase [Rhodocytophaga rosea]QHT66347.1 IS110 family transposase [Rhodocytophaga rosea]QHT69059.1 IS110 family transposase [Rhodocytophaga rosea]